MLLWHSAMMLALDAATVMDMRLRMLASGRGSLPEMVLMMSEKYDAWEDARRIVVRGGNPLHVIDNYRRIVTANVARLSGR